MQAVWCAVLAVLGASGGASAWAEDAWGEPALRLPGEAGGDGWRSAPPHALRLWAGDLSDRLAQLGQPRLPVLRWRVDGASPPASGNAETPILLERNRTALTAHWQPWSMGAWRLGAALGVSRALPHPSGGAGSFAAMPMASYQQRNYRVNLSLVAPRGARESALLVGLSVPLR